jgi:hypothetical protein
MEEHTMTADNSWTLQILRDDLSRTRLVEAPLAAFVKDYQMPARERRLAD